MATATEMTGVPEQELAALASSKVEPSPGEGNGAGQVPSRVLLAPWGSVESSSGEFVVDEEGTQLAIDAFEAQATDLPIDYEHQTLGGQYASPSGQAPAAGWIKRLEAVPGEGLFATVEWTQPAMEQLAAKQYRFISPVAVVRKPDRKLVRLHSAALTNKPAIVGIRPIVNRTEAAVTAEESLSEERDMGEAADRLRQQLGLGHECRAEQIMIAASERIEQLAADASRREAEDRVTIAMKAGKLTECQSQWALELAMRDPAAFDSWEQTAPVIIPPGMTEAPHEMGDGDRGHAVVIARARAEFHQHPELELLTSEEAYVEDALRVSGHEPASQAERK